MIKFYNLEYWQGDKHESTVVYNRTRPQLNRLKTYLKNNDSRYKIGKLKLKEVK